MTFCLIPTRRLHLELTQRVCLPFSNPLMFYFGDALTFEIIVCLSDKHGPTLTTESYANSTNTSSHCAAYVMISARLAHHLSLRPARTPLCAEAALCGSHVVGTSRRDRSCTGRHKSIARPQTRWGGGGMEHGKKRGGRC